MLVYIIISTFIVSLLAFLGLIVLSIKGQLFNKIMILLVALSAGGLMGGAFIHLMPEAIEESSVQTTMSYTLTGFISFFFIEKVFYWRHCHKGKCDVHEFAYMNLLGEVVHNLIDGIVIAASYVTNLALGVTTTIAVMMHEIPQELGDFGVLVYGGFSKKKALIMNFLVALTAIAGGFIGYYLTNSIQGLTPILLAITAGGFIYIASSDLLPEIRKEKDIKKSTTTFLTFTIGIMLMLLLK